MTINHWVACFESVLYDKEISSTELRLYLHMKFRHDYLKLKEKRYFESYETMQDKTGISKRSIVTAVKKLEDKGLIRVNRRGKQTSLIDVLL